MKHFLLRWRYDFSDGKVIAGMWSNPGKNQANQAWFHNKEGMIRASIEAKDLATSLISTVAECKGEDFRNFQWMAAAKVKPLGIGGEYSPQSTILGLRLLTRNNAVEAFVNGTGNTRPLTEGEKKIEFATYGK